LPPPSCLATSPGVADAKSAVQPPGSSGDTPRPGSGGDSPQPEPEQLELPRLDEPSGSEPVSPAEPEPSGREEASLEELGPPSHPEPARLAAPISGGTPSRPSRPPAAPRGALPLDRTAPGAFGGALRGTPPRPTRDLGGVLGRAHATMQLSPRMTAIFGGLFGLATVTSIVALLIQAVPPRDERSVIASASASAAGAPAPVAAPPPSRKPKRVAIPGPWRITELEKDPSSTVASATMDRRSFIDALADKGVPKAQAYRIMKAFEGVRKFDKPGRKERFTVAMERASKRVRAFEYQVSPTEIYQAREDQAGLLAAVRLDLKIAEGEVVNAFYVGSDLTESYAAAGLEDGILSTLDEAFEGRISTESFEEGSVVRIIAVEQTALGLFASYKGVIAVEYRPRDPGMKPIRIYHFNGEQSHGYFDERGRQPYAGGWRSPIPGAPVTSRFNPKRMHPVLHKVMPHQGTDFGAPMGTPVFSAYRGVVDSVGPSGPSGNLVTINHANGVTTGYAHLSKFAIGIKHGDKVGTHQLVGYVGTTGRSTGPHLHFSAKRDGKFFDAETLQLDGERVLPTADRAAFLALKAELDKRLEAIPLPEPPPEKPKAVAAVGSGTLPAGASPPAVEEDGGIHPSSMVEDNSEDDDEGDQVIGAPALGAVPPPAAPSTARPATKSKEPVEEEGIE